jgi:hypothetical protein
MEVKNIDNNKDKIKEYAKQYHKDNTEMIKQKRQQKMQCSKCGKVVTKQSVWAHKKSKKCLRIQGLLPDENNIDNQTVGTF